ncbi:tyrosyl-tRNA synthetase [Kiloniella litopenaei]|uniref:Tyrosine--tRNA ligase n=1 Tax=Kiloniella litopenaei TaxID=1549748 RepID=A0A0M2RFI4_9PROT|nr:tyrosine--tRNA ligase [Kiloniella litopenaei]KKJ78313.1 tyrosyl-tRNA synthetase [Kiloniella litopenaei]
MTAPQKTDFRSEFLRELSARGYIHQCTDLDALDAKLEKGPVAAYIGFDCTADSLHVGGLIQIMLLRWLQKTGHKPIVLMGGGTSKVGDPSFKDEARKLITEEEIQRNMDGIKKVFSKYLTFGDGPTDAVMVNNADWLDNINYLEFLRDYGVHFSVNRMLSFDSVKLRLDREQSLSFLEFNYMILQAYDFMELNKRRDCLLQMGGSDQWGNIVNGVDLTRRISQNEVYGLTSPLLTTSSGVKMGKTVGGAVWLNEERLSVYDFWQYWRNTEDADVGRFLRLFTELSEDEIQKLEAMQGADINEAKKILATEVTRLCHGIEAAEAAAETARKAFEERSMSADLPSHDIEKSRLEEGIPAFLLFKEISLANSNSEARKLIKGGGGRLNDTQIKDDSLSISLSDLNDEGSIKISAGKKRHILVKPV